MTKILSCSVLLAALLVAAPASAGGSKGSVGVGADVPLSRTAVPEAAVEYDAGVFHVGGGLGIDNPQGANNTDVEVSGHFYYHVASTSMADFGLGGDILFQNIQRGPNNGSNTNVYLEPGFQIRAFIASNVALLLGAGMEVGVGDDSHFFLGANAVADAGFRYYFF